MVSVTDERLTPEKLRVFEAAHPAPYTRLDVVPGSMPSDLPSTVLGLTMRPISYLIGPDGVVAKRFIGGLDASDIAFVDAATR